MVRLFHCSMAGRDSPDDLLPRPAAAGGGDVDVDCSLRLGPPGASATAASTVNVDAGPMMQLRIHGAGGAVHLRPPAPFGGGYFVTELCTMCATTNTPLWRTGPYGPKSLCNACGIRYKKEEKRLALSLASSPSSSHSHSKARHQNQAKKQSN